MHFPSRFCLGLSALALVAFAGCKPPPENIKITDRVYGPPDLAGGKANETNRSYQLRAFHLNHIWADPARKDDGRPYRAKVTLWDYAEDGSVVAEVYFDDDNSQPAKNPDPNHTGRPFRLHFPISTLAPILNTVRNTNEPVFLYYYEGSWSIGTYTAEPVGSD